MKEVVTMEMIINFFFPSLSASMPKVGSKIAQPRERTSINIPISVTEKPIPRIYNAKMGEMTPSLSQKAN